MLPDFQCANYSIFSALLILTLMFWPCSMPGAAGGGIYSHAPTVMYRSQLYGWNEYIYG